MIDLPCDHADHDRFQPFSGAVIGHRESRSGADQRFPGAGQRCRDPGAGAGVADPCLLAAARRATGCFAQQRAHRVRCAGHEKARGLARFNAKHGDHPVKQDRQARAEFRRNARIHIGRNQHFDPQRKVGGDGRGNGGPLGACIPVPRRRKRRSAGAEAAVEIFQRLIELTLERLGEPHTLAHQIEHLTDRGEPVFLHQKAGRDPPRQIHLVVVVLHRLPGFQLLQWHHRPPAQPVAKIAPNLAPNAPGNEGFGEYHRHTLVKPFRAVDFRALLFGGAVGVDAQNLARDQMQRLMRGSVIQIGGWQAIPGRRVRRHTDHGDPRHGEGAELAGIVALRAQRLAQPGPAHPFRQISRNKLLQFGQGRADNHRIGAGNVQAQEFGGAGMRPGQPLLQHSAHRVIHAAGKDQVQRRPRRWPEAAQPVIAQPDSAAPGHGIARFQRRPCRQAEAGDIGAVGPHRLATQQAVDGAGVKPGGGKLALHAAHPVGVGPRGLRKDDKQAKHQGCEDPHHGILPRQRWSVHWNLKPNLIALHVRLSRRARVGYCVR